MYLLILNLLDVSFALIHISLYFEHYTFFFLLHQWMVIFLSKKKLNGMYKYKIKKTQFGAIKKQTTEKEEENTYCISYFHRITTHLTCSVQSEQSFLHLPDTHWLIPLFSTLALMLSWLINQPLNCFPSSPNPNVRASASILGNGEFLPPFYLSFSWSWMCWRFVFWNSAVVGFSFSFFLFRYSMH